MRKIGIIAAFLFLMVGSALYAQNAISLDTAIVNSSQRIQEGLNIGAKIIVYQFQTHDSKLSDYILHELFDKLVNSRRFIVLDRTAQEVVNAELDFQFNISGGMISDESLANITRRIGAEAIITGSLDDTGDNYRYRIRVIGTETMMAIVSYTVSIDKNDRRIAGFRPKEPKTTAEKIGTGALNIVLGLGSYIEGDIAGGITVTAGYAITAGLLYVEATMFDWDNPAVGIPATVGVGVAGLTLVYGFVRPFIYNRSPKTTAIIDNTQLRIVQTPDTYNVNRLGFQIAYTIKF